MTQLKSSITFSATGLVKQMGALRLFERASIDLSNGELAILRGMNGSGKTTLLRILAGLLEPDEGSICGVIEGEVISGAEVADICHYLGHNNALKPEQTVRQNLQFWHVFGGNRSVMHHPSPVLAASRQLNFERLLDLPVSVLSAGQKRRVAFARLLVTPRPIWLLDEPTAALDTQTSVLAEHVVAQHLEAGGICVAATHLPFLEAYPSLEFEMANVTQRQQVGPETE